MQLNEFRKLFIANAAARYLYPANEKQKVKNDEWLEWEATVLAPVLANFGVVSKSEKLRNLLVQSLKRLNENLENSFLTEVRLGKYYIMQNVCLAIGKLRENHLKFSQLYKIALKYVKC